MRFKRKTKNLFNFRSINKNVADIRLLGHSVCDRLLDELVDFLFGVEVRSSDIAVDFDIGMNGQFVLCSARHHHVLVFPKCHDRLVHLHAYAPSVRVFAYQKDAIALEFFVSFHAGATLWVFPNATLAVGSGTLRLGNGVASNWYDTSVPKFFITSFARSTSFAFTAARLTVCNVAQFNGGCVTASLTLWQLCALAPVVSLVRHCFDRGQNVGATELFLDGVHM